LDLELARWRELVMSVEKPTKGKVLFFLQEANVPALARDAKNRLPPQEA